jgi:histidinol-phosphate aminotransferase
MKGAAMVHMKSFRRVKWNANVHTSDVTSFHSLCLLAHLTMICILLWVVLSIRGFLAFFYILLLLLSSTLQILKAITPHVKLVFVCSPGNPTAKAIPLDDIRAIAGSPEAQNCLIVVDEAYVDFSSLGSAVTLLQDYPNIVVLQTLSKAFGLAAIRCGFCYAAPDIIQLLNNVKAPYNINALTSAKALEALHATEGLQHTIHTLLEQRTVVMQALRALPYVTHVFDSDANFVLFRLQRHAYEVYKCMADAGIVTRYRGSELHCEECIRVTIGTPEENQAFLEAFQKTYAELDI